MRKNQLPYEGGFDENCNLTKNPEIIIENELALPIGLWKGAGLSLATDLIASVLSDGKTTMQIGKNEDEYALSQLFLCFSPSKLGTSTNTEKVINDVILNLKESSVINEMEIRYPGEKTLAIRKISLEKGVPVNPKFWNKVKKSLN